MPKEGSRELLEERILGHMAVFAQLSDIMARLEKDTKATTTGTPKKKFSKRAEKILASVAEYRDKNPNATARERLHAVFRLWLKGTGKDDAVTDLYSCLVQESDRGCVLVAAEVINTELERVLRAFFSRRASGTEAEVKKLFADGPDPPLRSAAMKIRICYVLGLIDLQLKTCLSKLQSFRSQIAAHSKDSFILRARDAVRIIEPYGGIKANPSIDDWLAQKSTGAQKQTHVVFSDKTARQSFVTAVLFLLMDVQIALKHAKSGRKFSRQESPSKPRASRSKTPRAATPKTDSTK